MSSGGARNPARFQGASSTTNRRRSARTSLAWLGVAAAVNHAIDVLAGPRELIDSL